MKTSPASWLMLLVLYATTADATDTKCWGQWINNNKPSDANNRTDIEPRPNATVLAIGCHTNIIQDAQCRDENGEAFTGTHNKTTSFYTVTCNYDKGLQCTPYPDYKLKNYTCPDFSIQFGCECPTQSPSSGSGPRGVQTTASAVHGITGSKSGATSATGSGTSSGNGASTGDGKPTAGKKNGGENSGDGLGYCILVHIIALMVSCLHAAN